MKTNREEILQHALRLFMTLNYERVSLQLITRTVGLTKTGIFNYYPTKLDLFVAVADKSLFSAQHPEHKFEASDGTLADFLEKYLRGVARTMELLVALGRLDEDAMPGGTVNAGYFHLFEQVLRYYPDGKRKLQTLMHAEYDLWREAVRRGVRCGELRAETDIEEAVALFRQVFVGLSYESSFGDGLDIGALERRFRTIYHLLKR